MSNSGHICWRKLMEYYYKIADLIIRMESFGKTVKQAEPYRCEPVERADMTVRSNWRAIKADAPHLSDESCEYIGTATNFYLKLLDFDGLMLHASAVMMDGKAYLFTAPSGTGKSTHTQLWLRNFGDRPQILNDDKPALRLIDGVWYAYGTPWSGKSDLNIPARATLAGVCVLERGEQNRIAPFRGKEAVQMLCSQTVRPVNATMAMRYLTLLDKLITQVPVWKLSCNMDPQAALVSYEAMSGERKDV